MRNRKLLIYTTSLFTIAGLTIGIYILFSKSAIGPLESKIIATFALIALVALFWIVTHLSSLNQNLLNKNSNIEKLLIDIRDGTKNFYAEKRRSPRLQLKSYNINAKFIYRDADEPIRVMDISNDGARLRLIKNRQLGDILDLNLHLPLFPRPIYIKAKVVRASKINGDNERGFSNSGIGFDVGVQYINVPRAEREKLAETIGLLTDSCRKIPQ